MPDLTIKQTAINFIYSIPNFKFFSFNFLFDSNFYLQCGFLLTSFLTSLIVYLSIRKKVLLIHNHFNKASRIFTHKTCYLFSCLISVGLLIPWYFIYVSHSISLISSVVIILSTATLTRLIRPFLAPYITLPFSFLIWGTCILILTDLFLPLINLLDQASFSIGVIHTSILKIIQSTLLIAILAWLTLSLAKKVDLKLSKNKGLNNSTKILLSKLFRTFLMIFSIFFGLSLVGIDLSIITFFAGALGVAIGFGLQNILSNIFCGIILLLDRSIRPGDVITLETKGNSKGTYGIIHKLNARYVSIRTREGIEHLIPNEVFINKQTENWTHSDSLVRVQVGFEVDIGTDIDFLEKLLIDIAKEDPRVCKEPAPNIRVASICKNCIEVKVRVWIADPENGLSSVRSHLYRKALIAFKQKGIMIPLPPLEVYLNQRQEEFSEELNSQDEVLSAPPTE